MTAKVLGPIGIKFLEQRGISAATRMRYGLYTARWRGKEIVPDDGGDVLVFPYVERGDVVAAKYRIGLAHGAKRYTQRPGGRRTFFNADALDDPALAEGRVPLTICEGELDCLTAVDCGFPLAVSVPDGAPAVPRDRTPEDLDPLEREREGTSIHLRGRAGGRFVDR